jgi:UDP-glucoronosyl and UDP-glucosyl transferase
VRAPTPNTQRYKQKMKYRSELFKNQPQHPLDRAIFWIEKAIKNNGLEYLRSPTLNMYFYEIHMLDIFFIIFIMAFGYIFIISYHIKAYKNMANRKKVNFDNNSTTTAAAATSVAASAVDDNGDDGKNHHGNIDDGKARRRKGKKGE